MLATTITCPNCLLETDAEAQVCLHCKAPLGHAAVLAEQELVTTELSLEDAPVAPEVLVPRLGDYLIEEKLLTQGDLDRALEYQKTRLAKQRPVLLGQALVQLDLIPQEILDEAVTHQIAQLQAALTQSNAELEHRVDERTAELQEALNKLTELNQLKSNFVSNISHELRTPLAHLIGYIDLFAAEAFGPLNNEQNEAITTLQEAYKRLQKLIDNLLEFSMLSQGQASLRMHPVSVREMLEVALSKTQSRADERQIKLRHKAPQESMVINADAEKIAWVLEQLLDNAIKFNQDGGKVQLEARREGQHVTLFVKDSGIGIPNEKLEDIFESFHQLDSSSTRRYGGTGLGLTMVKRIVEMHGSEVKVQSKLNQGSIFAFTLPLYG
ncbi:MAG: sensor histidine kinase [Chloroflexi bacterium]|nr:MAG: sensor histidine kinase [Chloroflexota bacterium]MBL1196872.1 sensor histidine kinase [Chloroflexota bacterium]NOH14168.1 HAMP domain-containing histidine kinase [Chloroflexota bacterium]